MDCFISPLVSIITPTYNSSNWIELTYESIKNQSYEHWEWLITDDCSTDGTYDLICELALKDFRIKVYKNEVNSGAAVSRNNSLSHVKGDFIAFIDSDDLWLKGKLKSQVEFMNAHDVNFSFTSYELINKNEELMGKKVDIYTPDSVSYEDMLRKKATMGCSTVMLRSSAFNNISMPLLRTGQDYALWLKLLKHEKKAYKVNKVLTQYRILPNSISRNKLGKIKRQWQIYRKVEGLSLLKSLVCFSFYAYNAVNRK